MQVQQFLYRDQKWTPALPAALQADWVLAFGHRALLNDAVQAMQAISGAAHVTACSTSGEIHDEEVNDETVSVSVVQFGKTPLRVATSRCAANDLSGAAGHALGAQLRAPDLKHVFVLSNGLLVNGTDLAHSLQQEVGPDVSISGGLAGDGPDFKTTLVMTNTEQGEDLIVAIGFYGEAIQAGCGSWGGWQPFGPQRVVTKSEGSVLYELDAKVALDKYKEYLGDQDGSMPVNALLFPMLITPQGSDRKVVRTVLAIDEQVQSMTFAGDIPVGATVQLMRSNTDQLVDGAREAAEKSNTDMTAQAELAILVSCIGRKLVMKQRVEEEVEAVREVIGEGAAISGFYSYGELAPRQNGEPCDLHNQTMTVTLLREVL